MTTNANNVNATNVNTTANATNATIPQPISLEGYRVILAPSKELAVEYAANNDVAASVEAEYGDDMVCGRIVTLAHHGPRCGNPAPCVAQVNKIDIGGTILVSHVDLDTLGGVMALTGVKPNAPDFWQGAAFVDVMGPHHIHELHGDVQSMLNAYYAFAEAHKGERYNTAVDITEAIEPHVSAIACICGEDTPAKANLLREGAEWCKRVTWAVEGCLMYEDENIRAFKTPGVFCSSSYYSHELKLVAKATVTLNTKFGAITVAFEDGGKAHSAKAIVQSLWGEGAGGRDGIAGSPRNWGKTEEELENEFQRAVDKVKGLF